MTNYVVFDPETVPDLDIARRLPKSSARHLCTRFASAIDRTALALPLPTLPVVLRGLARRIEIAHECLLAHRTLEIVSIL